jgi:hypothetical protein
MPAIRPWSPIGTRQSVEGARTFTSLIAWWITSILSGGTCVSHIFGLRPAFSQIWLATRGLTREKSLFKKAPRCFAVVVFIILPSIPTSTP